MRTSHHVSERYWGLTGNGPAVWIPISVRKMFTFQPSCVLCSSGKRIDGLTTIKIYGNEGNFPRTHTDTFTCSGVGGRGGSLLVLRNDVIWTFLMLEMESLFPASVSRRDTCVGFFM